jgi:hypothetical protein
MKKRFHYFNPHRLYQAIHLRPALLAKGLGVTEHRVLEVLARMMARETKPGTITEVDTCFPSIETLATEGLLKERAVRYALDGLLETGFITKSKIAGRKLHKGKNRNKFENNRYHVVPELWDTVESPFGGQAALAPAQPPAPPKASAPPVTSPEVSAADAEVIDSLDDVAPDADVPAPRDKGEEGTVGEIHKLLKIHFGDHPTYKLPDADQMMSTCVNDCINEAGAADTCLNALTWAFQNEKTRALVMKSRKLGGYILSSFSGWLEKHRQTGVRTVDTVGEKVLYQLCVEAKKSSRLGPESQRLLPELPDWFRDTLGEHFFDMRSEPIEGGLVRVELEVSDTCKVAHLIGFHTEVAIEYDRITHADEDMVEQARWAVTHEPWAAGLIKAHDPLAYFFENSDAIRDEMQQDNVNPAYFGHVDSVASPDDYMDEW